MRKKSANKDNIFFNEWILACIRLSIQIQKDNWLFIAIIVETLCKKDDQSYFYNRIKKDNCQEKTEVVYSNKGGWN